MTSEYDEDLLDTVDLHLRSGRDVSSDGADTRIPVGLQAQLERMVTARREIVAWLGQGEHDSLVQRAGLAAFELRERVGRGGQGEVWRAVERETGDVVAIKLLRDDACEDELRLRRFRREVEAAALLEHPSLCRVLGSGVDDGRPFLAMRYVDGPSIHEHLDGQDLTPAARVACACAMCVQLAEGLSAAHAVGIVHRDIKPGNVRVGSDGVPVLVDFGLALAGESSGSLTGDALVGTPAYMPPEALAAVGRTAAPHDERSDVWSFGVMLFELVTGRRPFGGPTRQVLYRAISEQAAPEPRTLNPAVSAELSLVILTCLEKRRADRYQSASQLAEDLRRVSVGKKPHVRRPSPVGRAVRWLCDNPALGLAGVGLAIALVVTLVLLRQAQVAERAAGDALAQEQSARRQSDGLRLVAESLRMASRSPGLAVRLAVESDDYLAGGSAAHRSVDAVIAAMEQPWEVGVWQLGGGAVRDVAFSMDGLQLVAGCDDGSVHSIGLQDGASIERLQVSVRPICVVQPLVGGGVVVGDVEGRCWELEPGLGRARPCPDEWGVVTALAADERVLAAGDSSGGVSLWKAVDGSWERLLRVQGHAGEVTGLDLREGELASCSSDGCVHVWSVESGRLIASHERRGIEPTDVALGPGGRRVLVASGDNRLLSWGVGPDSRETGAAGHGSGLYSAAYDPSGRYAVTTSFDRTAILWRVSDRHLLRRFEGHRRAVLDAEFAPDGEQIATASEDGSVRIWPALGHPQAQQVHAGKEMNSARFVGGERRVVVSGGRSAAGVWSLDTSERVLAVGSLGDAFVACAVSDDAALLGAVTSRGLVRVVRAESGEVVRSWPLDEALGLGRSSLCFSPDGAHVLVTNNAGITRVLSVVGDDVPRDLRGLAPFYRVGNVVRATFVDEQRVATVVEEAGRSICVIWRVEDGSVICEWDVGAAPTSSMVRHPDAARLLISHGVGRISEWGVDGGVCRTLHSGDSVITSARYGPTGGTVIATDRSGAIWVWKGAGQVEGDRIAAHESVAYDACVDPKGRWIASASWDGSAALWDLRSLRRVFQVRAHDAPVIDVGFAPGGDYFLTAGEDGMVRTWPVDPVAFARGCLRTGLIDAERARFAIRSPK